MADSNANIVNVFINAARSWPQRSALIHGKKSISYEALLESVQQAAGGLQDRGIRKGDAVFVAAPMSIELYTTVLALFYIGAVPVFIDAWVSRKRMAQCMDTVACKGFVASRSLIWLSLLIGSLRRIPVKTTPGALLKGKSIPGPADVTEDYTALVTFTTGSTGPPKAADRTHGLLHAQLAALRPILPQRQDVSFTTLPIVVLLHLAMGKTTVLPPKRFSISRPRSARHLEDAVLANGIETMVVSPSVMDSLARMSSLSGLRHIITGGGPVFPDLAKQIVTAFPQATATIVFGSTEAEPISHAAAADIASAGDAVLRELGLPVGLPDPAASVRIIPVQDTAIKLLPREAWEALCLPAGTVGEVVVCGAHVLKHYVNNPYAETIYKIQVGGVTWHRTGDAGRLDDKNQLYFLGRCTEIIYREGRSIFPLIVAYQLMQAPDISGAALLQVNDQIVAVIESRRKDESFIIPILASHNIADAKIIYLKKLPRDPRHLTKIDYAALRRRLSR